MSSILISISSHWAFNLCLDPITISSVLATFKLNLLGLGQRRLDSRHVTNFYESDSSLNMLMADPENFPKARVVAVFFGFPWFVFNELSWNPSQWFDVKIFFLEESSF